MDDVADFFDFSKPFERKRVPGGYINGRIVPDKNVKTDKIPKREYLGTEYSKDVIAAAEIGLLDEINEKKIKPCSSKSSMELMDIEDTDFNVDTKPVLSDEFFEKYDLTRKINVDLPIFSVLDEILDLIEKYQVVVLEGDTGCGKTTQVPQFIMENALRKREDFKIICTQPRRIAAVSIADRVCAERGWKLGTLVGYQVGLHKTVSPETKLVYCTTGILLQKIIKSKTLANYTHIILDEIHERDQDMDFLLIVIRKLMHQAPNVKIILMSATMNSKEFSEYFQVFKGNILIPAPVLKINARRLYTVKEFYLEELSTIITTMPKLNMTIDNPGIDESLYVLTLKLIMNLKFLDEKDELESTYAQKSSVLIFLPGINEIDKMMKMLDGLTTVPNAELKVHIVRLHSMISPEEQKNVFRRAPTGHRKIILATNIAESSITVPDVKYVVDFCLTKHLITDRNTNLTTLQLEWASRSNCRQRAGRAGRVMNGRVFRLVPRQFYEAYMSEYGTPEMIRCPLENIILKAKLLDMGPPHHILGLALNPPNLSDIQNTILILKEVGALYQTGKDEEVDLNDGVLTFVGRIMAHLPIDVHITRLIIFGYVFNVLEETIIIAAGLNVKSIFDFPYQNQLTAFSSKLTWSNGSGSDLFAMISAYRVWVSKYEQGQFSHEEAEATWARRFFINAKTMQEMHLLILELKSRLENLGIKQLSGYNQVYWLEHERSFALKVAIAGAFYPNYFLRKNNNQYETERIAYNTLCGRNPCNTIYLTKFDNDYIGHLYIKSIKDIFKKAMIAYKNIEVSFEKGTQKIFVTFNTETEENNLNVNNLRLSIPGRVCPEVYKAIKMRQLKIPTILNVLSKKEAIVYATRNGLGELVNGAFEVYKSPIKEADCYVIPSVFTKVERGRISHIDNCGKFWFQPEKVKNHLKQIAIQLNLPKSLYKFDSTSEIQRGKVVAVKLNSNFYRCKLLDKENVKHHSTLFKVILYDYGGVYEVNLTNLYGINHNERNEELTLPPQVFECYLAGIAPSVVKSIEGRWSKESTELFTQLVQQQVNQMKYNYIEIYSVVNGVSAVIIRLDSDSINDKLVENNLAQYCEENYKSKIDHDIRLRKQYEKKTKYLNFFTAEEQNRIFNEDYIRQSNDFISEKEINIEPPPEEYCKKKIELGGPMSPLETTCYSATRAGAWKCVRIEKDSVNSVLLNSNPQEIHETLIVAAHVNETNERDVLIARQTSIMPNIKGFSALMAMLFCPQMEIRRNKSKTRYSQILCGLGPKQPGSTEPLFAEHDIIVDLDIDIVESDIELINQIRYSINAVLYTKPGEEFLNITEKHRTELISKVKDRILQLLMKDRQYIEVESNGNDWCWNQIDVNDMHGRRDVYGSQSIFPLHDCMQLYNERQDHIENLRANCDLLYYYKKLNALNGEIKCELCGQLLCDIMQLRIHILSKLHRDRERQINFKENV